MINTRILKKCNLINICLLIIMTSIWSNLQAPSAHAASGNEVGIATGTSLQWTDELQLDDRVSDIKTVGATWVRMEFNWSEIQPDNPHDYRWGPYDRAIGALQKQDLKIMATLTSSPEWAGNEHCVGIVHSEEAERKCSPGNTAEFARFARAAVLRYNKMGVYAWEIWNEPNLTGHWKTARADHTIFVDPVAYARTANAAAHEIKGHQPDAFIVTGGLAPVYERRYAKGMRQSDYLRQMLPHLDKDLFDAVGIHPYSWPRTPDVAKDYNAFYTVDNGGREYSLKRIMIDAGWHNKQIWATEFGASTVGKRRDTGRYTAWHRPDHVSETKQARIIQMGVDLWRQKSAVGPIFIHSDSDRWLTDRGNENGYGLRRDDGSKKPAYGALQAAIEAQR